MLLSIAELQRRLIYACIVAGKSANFAKQKMQKLFPKNDECPFDDLLIWKEDGTLENRLMKARTGNYQKLQHIFGTLVISSFDLATCSVDDLETIKGIGPKTSRFFVLWTRPGARYAALDVHILRWLREQGYKAPKNTPSSKKRYAELEAAFLAEADKLGLTPGELDAQIWSKSSGVDWVTQNK